MKRCRSCWRGWPEALLGAIFFGGLWWTVRKGVASRRPALWFLGSLLLRTSIALAGFYVVARRPLAAAAAVPARIRRGAPRRDVADATGGELARPHGRPAMRLSPDELIFWQHGFLKLNATIVFTWGLMLVLAVGSRARSRASCPPS